jgi:N-methylhydantoinase B
LLGERGRFAPFGVAGGADGALNRFTWGSAGENPPMASKIVGVSIGQGERVRLETPGGGGWGDPAARSQHAIARDIRLGYVSAEAAARDSAGRGQ